MENLEAVALEQLSLFRFVPLTDWLILSCVNLAAQHWFERKDLWQAAGCLSAWRFALDQDANDVSQIRPIAFNSLAAKIVRVSSHQLSCESNSTHPFPAHSPLRIARYGSLWVMQDESLLREKSLLGAKTWQACLLMCAVLSKPKICWPEGLEALEGKAVVELGAGLGVLGVTVARHAHASRVLLTDGDESCVRLAETTIELNAIPMSIETEVLRFGEKVRHLWGAFDVVIAADVAYSLDLVNALWSSVARLLRKDSGVFIIGHMDRTPSATARLISRAAHHGFVLQHQHDLWSLQDESVLRFHFCPAMLFVFVRKLA